MKRTIEIEDSLNERVEDCKEELLNDFRDYLEDNADIDKFDTYMGMQGSDRINEIVDSGTPIYYSDIDGLYYLYGDDFEESYNNHGFGDGTEDNHKETAIYCYLLDKSYEFVNELESWFDDYLLENDLNNEQIRKAVLIEAVNELNVEDI